MIDIVILQALLATTTPLSKLLLTISCSPYILAGLRLLLGGAGLLLYERIIRRKSLMRISWIHVILFAEVICGTYIKYILKYVALSGLTATKASILYCITPLYMAFIGYYRSGEQFSFLQICALFFVCLSALSIFCTTSNTAYLAFSFSWYDAALIGAIMVHCYKYTSKYLLIKHHGYTAQTINSYSMAIAGFFILVTAYYTTPSFQQTNMAFSFGSIVYITLITTLLGHTWYDSLLKRYSPTVLALTDFLYPVFVAIYSFFLLHETISWHHSASFMCTTLGMLAFMRVSNHK